MESMAKKLKRSLTSGWMGKKKRKRLFLENGSIFLKNLIADCNGISIPIRNFPSSQILKATKNFDSTCLVTDEVYFIWYKGIIEGRSYMIKRYSEDRYQDVCNDIALSPLMSNHRNFLKLFGCCLELPIPVLVFEYAEHGNLNKQGRIMVNGEESIMPLSLLLKIAKETAIALTYLHMAFPKIIIHRDVKPTNILLDRNWTAKLSDFSLSITLPEGKSSIDDSPLAGTLGYIDPEYYYTDRVTEYIDVYSFGVFLMVILTGKEVFSSNGPDGECEHISAYVKDLYENGKLDEIIDPLMMKHITSGQRLHVEECVVLALKCCEVRDEDKPKMIQVAKKLKQIETSNLSS